MVLNYIWIAFFLVAFCIALVRLVFMGDTEVFPAIMNSTFDTSRTAFEISLGHPKSGTWLQNERRDAPRPSAIITLDLGIRAS